MSEWWSYRPEDFLLFSPRVYWRLFELHNAAWWPAQLATAALLAILIWLAAARPAGQARLIAAGLALAWAFTGWSFVWSRYATINWAAEYLAPLFAIEAVLLVLAASLGGLRSGQRDVATVAGWLLVAIAAAQPFLAPWAGRGWPAAEVFAIAPDPTAIATLGLLLVLRGPMTWVLVPIPLVWCALSALTLWTMGEPVAASLPLAACLLPVTALLATAVRAVAAGRPPRP
ncbi:DUF6064 family protein [Pseudoxanthobacter sp. M-2]|uniref:DUF6064 family protein n=1 Tax=Pseudoxanthobacter sp. M-2 TaxID=3078754 RepID=UPI0038FC19CE